MRCRLAAVLVLLAFPAAAAAQTPVLTIKAPGATAYGHHIEFDGRLSPAAPGTLVRIVRAGATVASGALRRDGTYRIPVQIAKPGPFQAVARGVKSTPLTVRIVPKLEATLVGPQVVGQKLSLVATLRPAEAGPVRIRVVRHGRATLDATYRGTARIQLGTQDLDAFDVRVESLPRPGYEAEQQTVRVALVPPHLAVGSISPAVEQLQHKLAALHYAIPAYSSTFSYDFIESVYAFQKVTGLERTGEVDPSLWARLQHATVPQPRYAEPADHIEVDKTRQVLFIVRGGQVALISPVSTAGIAGYHTPEGKFAIYRKVVGYDKSPLGVLLDPMYFYGGYAIHGNPSVPPYPASHGCIRVPNFVIYRLFDVEPYGETVYVY
jgi:L,D-transpeptidase-like protein/putative peptidoglycan binding protein